MGPPSAIQNFMLPLLKRTPMGGLLDLTRGGYDSTALHSFGNAPVRPPRLVVGGTHVDVGFNDLAGLAEGLLLWEREGKVQLRPKQQRQQQPSSPSQQRQKQQRKRQEGAGMPEEGEGAAGEPAGAAAGSGMDGKEQGVLLRWVGYEASAYAVAKTLVVAEMAREGAEADHVVQARLGEVALVGFGVAAGNIAGVQKRALKCRSCDWGVLAGDCAEPVQVLGCGSALTSQIEAAVCRHHTLPWPRHTTNSFTIPFYHPVFPFCHLPQCLPLGVHVHNTIAMPPPNVVCCCISQLLYLPAALPSGGASLQ